MSDSKSLALLVLFGLVLGSSARAQGTDLLFLVDETATMSDEILSLKTNASSVIVPSAVAALGDVAFGVARYRDFAVSPFGDPGDSPYSLLLSMSTNSLVFQNALNVLSAAVGGDIPEANLHALHSAGTMPPGWRAGAARVIFWIGDAPGHDGDLEPSYAGCCSSVGLADASTALTSAGIAAYAFSAGRANARTARLKRHQEAEAATAAEGVRGSRRRPGGIQET